jgi:preprotein translocase subunit YajC
VSGGGSIIILLGLFAVLWLVLIRPQKARQQRQQQLLSNVEPGDEVLTVGGLYGIVQSVDEENDLIVEIAEGIHVRIARRAIATVVKPDEEEEEAEGEDAADEDDEPQRGESARNGAVATVTRDEDVAGPDGEAAGETGEATRRRLFGRRN